MNLLNLPARAVLAVLAAALVVGCGARERPADRTTDATGKGDEAPPVHKGAETNMKTIGVLGGLGPQATMDFEARIHRVAQRLIRPNYNRGYPPMVVSYYRHPPVLLTEQDEPRLPFRPDPRLLEAAKRLGGMADFLVITANTPHLFRAEIEQAAGRKVLSRIDTTLEEVRRRKWKRVGVLGLGDPVFYTRPLGQLGIACETMRPESRASLDKAICRLREGRDDAESAAAAREAVATLRARGVDGVVLGCTEIPLLLRESADAADLMNPAQLLAEAPVRVAVK
jgi:aspartate racemase